MNRPCTHQRCGQFALFECGELVIEVFVPTFMVLYCGWAKARVHSVYWMNIEYQLSSGGHSKLICTSPKTWMLLSSLSSFILANCQHNISTVIWQSEICAIGLERYSATLTTPAESSTLMILVTASRLCLNRVITNDVLCRETGS